MRTAVSILVTLAVIGCGDSDVDPAPVELELELTGIDGKPFAANWRAFRCDRSGVSEVAIPRAIETTEDRRRGVLSAVIAQPERFPIGDAAALTVQKIRARLEAEPPSFEVPGDWATASVGELLPQTMSRQSAGDVRVWDESRQLSLHVGLGAATRGFVCNRFVEMSGAVYASTQQDGVVSFGPPALMFPLTRRVSAAGYSQAVVTYKITDLTSKQSVSGTIENAFEVESIAHAVPVEDCERQRPDLDYLVARDRCMNSAAALVGAD